MNDNLPIRTVAAVIVDARGRVLLVRTRGSDTFIQPGGQREPGQDALTTPARATRGGLGARPPPARQVRRGRPSSSRSKNSAAPRRTRVGICSDWRK